jgi:hypothetical protein
MRGSRGESRSSQMPLVFSCSCGVFKANSDVHQSRMAKLCILYPISHNKIARIHRLKVPSSISRRNPRVLSRKPFSLIGGTYREEPFSSGIRRASGRVSRWINLQLDQLIHLRPHIDSGAQMSVLSLQVMLTPSAPV